MKRGRCIYLVDTLKTSHAYASICCSLFKIDKLEFGIYSRRKLTAREKEMIGEDEQLKKGKSRELS